MKKRCALLVFFVGCLCATLSASQIQFQFTAVPDKPLMGNFQADYFAPKNMFHVGYFFDNAWPKEVYTEKSFRDEVDGTYAYYLRKFSITDKTEWKPLMAFLQTGINTSLLRISTDFGFLPDLVSLEITLRAMIGSVMYALESSEQLSVDGYYLYGLNLGYAHWLTMTIGYEHNSGHYGDDVSRLLRKYNGNDLPSGMLSLRNDAYGNENLVEWVRQDPLVIQLSVKPLSWLRMYGGVRINQHEEVNVRPRYHRPSYWKDRAEEEGNPHKYDWYKDWRLQTGIEFDIPFHWLFGNLQIGFDMQFSQNGQVLYREFEGKPGFYGDDEDTTSQYYIPYLDRNHPWMFEFGIMVRQLLSKPESKVEASIDFYYRNGRMPMMNFFDFNASFFSIGGTLSL